MMRRWIVALACAVVCPAATMASDDVKGSLVIIGGALRTTDNTVWSTIVELAGGAGAKIAVFPTASSQPVSSGDRVADLLRKLGAEPFVVPVGLQNIDVDYQKVVNDPEWAAKVRGATGVYFTGGSQARITQALLTKEGSHTPVLNAIWDVYRKGGVVAGTSAGAAIMSQTMFAHPQSVLTTLHQGVRMGVEIDRGLGFLDPNWFVDQHCLVRGRFARAIVAMHAKGIRYGLGIDEDTAVVVKKGTEMSVAGYKGCLIFDLSEAKRDDSENRFNLQNVKMSYLDRGDSINLQTMAITPHELKRENPKIDPQSPEFRPTGRKPIFTNDILANAVVTSLMSQILTHVTGEATGLAYDGHAAREGGAEGFEFRLYRGKDTCGWHTDDEGYDAFTVSNVRMDVEPISLSAPLYSYARPNPTNPHANVAKKDASGPSPTTTAAVTPASGTVMVKMVSMKSESEVPAQK